MPFATKNPIWSFFIAASSTTYMTTSVYEVRWLNNTVLRSLWPKWWMWYLAAVFCCWKSKRPGAHLSFDQYGCDEVASPTALLACLLRIAITWQKHQHFAGFRFSSRAVLRPKITMMIVSLLVMVLTFVLVESAIVRNDLAGFERWDSLKGDCFSSFRSQTDCGERKIIASNFPEIYKFKTIQKLQLF